MTLTDLDIGFYAIGLQWDDNYYSLGEGGALYDMDIYLTDAAGNPQKGDNIVNTGGDPIEIFYFNVNTAGADTFPFDRVCPRQYSGSGRNQI